MVAAHQGYTDIVDMLVRAGARASAADNDGDTAVDYFCLAGQLNTRIATMLILNGGDITRLYQHGYEFEKWSGGSWRGLKAHEVSRYDLQSGELMLACLNQKARDNRGSFI